MSRKLRAAAFSVLLALAFLPRVFCQEAASNDLPKATYPQPRYEKPKASAIREALERSLVDLADAQNQLRALIADGKIKRSLGIQGVWVAVDKSTAGPTNSNYSAVFESQSGPLLGFEKTVFVGDDHRRELLELRYKIGYYNNGRVKYYMRWGPGSLDFYPDGTLKKFSAKLDERTSCEVSWDAEGSLQFEGTSVHLPQSEKSLPELADMLRHGDNGKKREAAWEMWEIGSPSIPYALSVLKDGDDKSRELAASTIGELREKAEPAVPELARFLQEDPSAAVQREIAIALGMIGPAAKTAVPALEEAATNNNTDVAEAAKISLGLIRRPSIQRDSQ